jgi:hypothetical protein
MLGFGLARCDAYTNLEIAAEKISILELDIQNPKHSASKQ